MVEVFSALCGMSSSDFAQLASGEYGEDFLNKLIGVFGKLQDDAERAEAAIADLIRQRDELAEENARLRQALASIANRINVEGSPWHEAQAALDKVVVSIKSEARAALAKLDAGKVQP
jgi:phage shock protein A